MATLGPVQDGPPIADGVSGTALVVDGNPGFSNLASWTGGYRLQVRVPGRDPYKISHSGWIPREKHPVPGFELPVTASKADPSVLRVEWDRAPTMDERIAGRDPAIVDPETTWRRVAPLRFIPAGATKDQIAQVRDMVAAYLPADSVVLEDIDAAAMRGDASTYDVTPWQKAQQPVWPPAAGTVDAERVPAIALTVSISADPYPYMRGDTFFPPGSHFSSHGGSVQCSKYEYLGWLLLCVIPPSGARYGVYLRTQIRSRHVGLVLPVTVGRDNPHDVEVEWDAAPNIVDATVDRIDSAIGRMQATVTDMTTLQQSSVTAALANVQDPAIRAQVTQMWSRLGVDTSVLPPPDAPPPFAPAPAAPPQDLAASLVRLVSLRDTGVLTESEYQTERSKILNSI
ncbi:MAG: hypothetical protein QOI15_10 [Pseudonocardiales bacterium]|nr:hypothetical protein [Pseudonocardiales bacterium]